MEIIIGNYEPPEAESYRIEYWYNRHTHDWVIQVFDNFDREVKSEYCPDKEWRDNAIKYYSEKYNTTDIKKV